MSEVELTEHHASPDHSTTRGEPMNTIPDSLPVLSEGNHNDPSKGACFMEFASILAGEEFSDHPACTHPVLAELARSVNDRLPDEERHRIAHLIPSVIGTADTREDGHARQVLSVQLAVWCARQVLDLVPDQIRAVCAEALDITEAWTRCGVTREECQRIAHSVDCAANAVYAANQAALDNDADYSAAYAADAATYAADATYAATYAADYAANAAARAAVDADYAANAAADATHAAAPDRLIGLLEGCITEHARLTGHQPAPITADQWDAALVSGLGDEEADDE